jgi:head-tail adaptor
MSRTARIGAGDLDHLVSLEAPVFTPDGYGGEACTWEVQFQTWAALFYRSGGEGLEAGVLQGQLSLRCRLRQSDAARLVTTDWRLVHRGTVYNVREVDRVTSREWVYLGLEAGVAT